MTIAQVLFGILESNKKSLALFKLACPCREILHLQVHMEKHGTIFFKALKENVKYELKLEKGEKFDKNHLTFKWKWQIINSCLITQ